MCECLADFKPPQKGQKASKSKKGKSKKEEEEKRRQREEGHSYLSFFFLTGIKLVVKNLTPSFVCRGSATKSGERGAGKARAREEERRDREA